MNANKRVLLFVVYSVGLFLLLSVMGIIFGWTWMPFQRVNLISDLVADKKIDSSSLIAETQPLVNENSVANTPFPDFELYRTPRYITHFHTDTQRSSLPQLAEKLHRLKTTGKGKIRIAYFGDSMIEGDLMSQTLRKLMQETFGGQGVGFVPITSQVSHFRQTVSAVFSSGWVDENFKEGKSRRLHLSGHLFRTDNDWVTMTDNTIRDRNINIEKSLLCGPYSKEININVNSKGFPIQPKNLFNRIVLSNDTKNKIAVGIGASQLPVYGISFESENGVFVDNFSFRGITGIELAQIESSFLKSIAEENPYDLLIFQYGVNLLYRPKDVSFSWYGEIMKPVMRRFSENFSPAELVLVSTADRAFRMAGKYQTAAGMDSLLYTQASVAMQTGVRFYNQFESMGGANSIVEWAKAKPSLANQDHVHPNFRGAEILAGYFYEAIMNEYYKHLKTLED